jgi:peptidoglycan/LPS O-acetylase OafA/YrhL
MSERARSRWYTRPSRSEALFRYEPQSRNRDAAQRGAGTALSGSPDRLPSLDGLRGLAILLVMFGHFAVYDGMPVTTVWADRAVKSLGSAGWVGVDLFFVLSGYLITGILYDSRQGRHYFRSFYARRVLRIFPVYYGALLVFLVILPNLVPSSRALALLRADSFWYWTYLINVRIAFEGFPAFPALGHFWSLAVEEQFYLIWPLVVLLFSRTQLARICGIGVAAAFALRVAFVLGGHGEAAYVLTPARMDALAIGAWIALTARGPVGMTGLSKIARPAAVLCGSLVVALWIWRGAFAPWDVAVKTVGHTLLSVLFGATLVLAVTSRPETRLARAFGSSVLQFFGRYSYALYVVHVPVLFFNPGALLPLDYVPTVFGSLLLKKAAFTLALTAFSVAIALLSWHLCEKHFIRLKRFFPYGSAETRPLTPRASLVPARAPGIGD